MSKLKAETKALAEPLAGGGAPGTTVKVEPLLGGSVLAPPQFFESRGGRLATVRMLGIGTPKSRWWLVPVPVYLITHPTAGQILVDTGFHGSVAAKPAANLGKLAARFARPRIEPGRDIPSQLRERGLDEADLKTVVLTHLHFDHASGIAEYPEATFVLSQAEWEAATTDPRPILRGYRPSHYDYLFDYRTVDFDGPTTVTSSSPATRSTPRHSSRAAIRHRDRSTCTCGAARFGSSSSSRAPTRGRRSSPGTTRSAGRRSRSSTSSSASPTPCPHGRA